LLLEFQYHVLIVTSNLGGVVNINLIPLFWPFFLKEEHHFEILETVVSGKTAG